MNETKLTPRHNAIIRYLAQKPVGASRVAISTGIAGFYPVSKPTLARDLQLLVHQKHIIATGVGRSTLYKTMPTHPLLNSVDLTSYFLDDPDKRTLPGLSFDFSLFGKLKNLFSTNEERELQRMYKNISERGRTLDPTIYKRELERFVIEFSWKSSKIEGNTYSLLETEALILRSEEASGRTKEEALMILNHKHAFETIVAHPTQFAVMKTTDIVQLHNMLVKDLHITAGIRKHAVGISGTGYKPPDNEWQIREALEEIVSCVNASSYPLEKALIASVMIAYLQPFADGNKRTARTLSNAILIAEGYYPLSYRSVDENEYKKALILFYETGNLYHCKRLFIEQYRFALQTYFV